MTSHSSTLENQSPTSTPGIIVPLVQGNRFFKKIGSLGRGVHKVLVGRGNETSEGRVESRREKSTLEEVTLVVNLTR